MAKKKSSEQLSVSNEQVIEDRGYTVGLWAWHDQYRCKQCDFDTLELGVMEEHLMMAHGTFVLKEPAPPPPSTAATSIASAQDGETSEGEEKADGIFEIDLKEDQ